MSRPIVTFTTDFGLADTYVAEMKAAVLGENPDATLVDVTHLIRPQDVMGGSLALSRALNAFPKGTIHVGVVDPGVGTKRRILVVKINRQRVICPDNGMITWAWRMDPDAKAYQLTWEPKHFSATFHGRDIMAPAAGMLSRGKPIKALAKRVDQIELLNIGPATSRKGEIIYIDHFGNCITNILGHPGAGFIRAGKKSIGVQRTYGNVPKGKPLALIGSAGLLEIAIRDGNAAKTLGLRVGHEVIIG
jgi:S-adenosylmethionine hydrolase